MDKFDIFLSYRRDGGEALACLICERLRQREYRVFYDVESLRSGKFNEEIYTVINNCKDVICILPEHGLDRCTDPNDWVRREIAYAIEKKKNIIPVMMRNFTFPKELPEDLKELPNYQGICANMEYFTASFEKLLNMLYSSEKLEEDELCKFTTDSKIIDKIHQLTEEVRFHNTPTSFYKLARCYYYEIKNPALYEKVALLCRKAAAAGLPEAQNMMGILYERGHGMEQNISKAFEWYYKASFNGSAEAQYNMALCFQKKYKTLSAYWMEQAAVKGNENAICEIAEYYDTGYGVQQNREKAEFYYRILAEKGNKFAKRQLNNIHKLITQLSHQHNPC